MEFIRLYGTATAAATHITIPIIKAGSNDFAVSADWTPAAGDVKVSKDGGTAANITTLPTFLTGIGWVFQFSATEMQAARINVTIVDSATKAIEDQAFVIITYGNASALVKVNWGDAVRGGMTALPNAAADAAGGLAISDAGGLDLDSIVTKLNTIESDTNELQSDDVPGLIAALNDVSQADITGGAYSLDTDANGRIRGVEGTGAGEWSRTGGLPDGIAGTLNTFDDLDTAQDSQHAQTQSDIAALENLSAAEAEAAADAALVSIHLDHLLAADYDPASKPGISTALLNELIESDSGVSRFTANALEQGPSGGGGGGDGSGFTDIPWNSAWDAEVQSEVADALAAYDPPTRSELTSDVNSVLAILGTPAGADLAADIAALPTQSEITGGAWSLDTDSNGRIRIVDGTGTGEIDTASGRVEIAGTLNSLDDLDTAQDTQHAATLAAIAALNDLSWADVWTGTAFTEDYAADGVLPTPAQSLQAIEQYLTQIGYAGTTATAGKRDGSTAFTLTMDDSSNPTSIKRVAV